MDAEVSTHVFLVGHQFPLTNQLPRSPILLVILLLETMQNLKWLGITMLVK